MAGPLSPGECGAARKCRRASALREAFVRGSISRSFRVSSAIGLPDGCRSCRPSASDQDEAPKFKHAPPLEPAMPVMRLRARSARATRSTMLVSRLVSPGGTVAGAATWRWRAGRVGSASRRVRQHHERGLAGRIGEVSPGGVADHDDVQVHDGRSGVVEVDDRDVEVGDVRNQGRVDELVARGPFCSETTRMLGTFARGLVAPQRVGSRHHRHRHRPGEREWTWTWMFPSL